MFIQGDLQAVFDALYSIGAIDPVLSADWTKINEAMSSKPQLVNLVFGSLVIVLLIFAPGGSDASVPNFGATRTSRGSSRRGMHVMTRPSGCTLREVATNGLGRPRSIGAATVASK